METENDRKGTLAGAAVALLAVLLVAGCAATVEDYPALQEAQNEYQQLQQDPQARKYAADPLYEAEQQLQQARQAIEDGADEAEIRHRVYLAQQQLEIARNRTQQGVARAEQEQLANERQQVVLQLREQEAEQARQRAEMAKLEVQRLEQSLAELQAKAEETERGLVLTLGNMLFEFDSAQLNPGVERNLRPLAEFLQENPDRAVLIEGHTDAVGDETYNQQLSERRAQAVKDELVAMGIAPDRLVARGYGEQYPVASNDNIAGRQQNRRVDVVILRPGENAQDNGRT